MNTDDALDLLSNPEVEDFLDSQLVSSMLHMMAATPLIGNYHGAHHWVLENGHYQINSQIDRKLGEAKHCFSNSQALMMKDPDTLLYAEGFVLVHGVPIHHGWNVYPEGAVVDTTLRIKGCEYYGAVFDSMFVLDHILDRGETISLLHSLPLLHDEDLTRKALLPNWPL